MVAFPLSGAYILPDSSGFWTIVILVSNVDRAETFPVFQYRLLLEHLSSG